MSELEPRVVAIEKWRVGVNFQIGRLVSDTESEKGTRKRLHDDFQAQFQRVDVRFQRIERVLWTSTGIMGVLQVIVIGLLMMYLRR
jgi:hypothetical protein